MSSVAKPDEVGEALNLTRYRSVLAGVVTVLKSRVVVWPIGNVSGVAQLPTWQNAVNVYGARVA